MKKYFALGITLVALVAILLCWSWEQGSADNKPIAFYGKAPGTVTVCLLPDGFPCFSATTGPDNMYYIQGPIPHGWYGFPNSACNPQAFYSGNSVRVDFCIPRPGSPCSCSKAVIE